VASLLAAVLAEMYLYVTSVLVKKYRGGAPHGRAPAQGVVLPIIHPGPGQVN
jgi:hypothetical protein